MYVKRKYRRKRVAGRRKRINRRNVAKRVNVKKDTHYFKRFAYKATINGDVSRTAKGALTFSLNDLPGLTDYTSLFDYYKISGVKLRITTFLDANSQAPGNSFFPKMYSCIDYDDANVPTDSDEMRQRTNCKIRWLAPNRSYSVFLRPKYLKNVYISGVSSGYEIGKQQWLDLSNTNIPHYGFKYVIENLFPDLGQCVQIEATYYLSFKGAR